MIRGKRYVFMMAMAFFALSLGAWAQVPQMLNYQGRLTNSDGNPIKVKTAVSFSFWTHAQQGQQIAGYTANCYVTPDQNGFFSVVIGDGSAGNAAIPLEVFTASDVWLNVAILGENLMPRKRLLPVGYAFRSAASDMADNTLMFDGKLPSAFATSTHNHDTSYSKLSHLHDERYSLLTHNHNTSYSAINHLHDTRYSLLTHDHNSSYSAINHNHDAAYSAKNHNHDTSYSKLSHLHDERYSLLTHNHDTSYSSINHLHDTRYSLLTHDHNSSYSAINHLHDSRYSLLTHDHNTSYAAKNHNHDTSYSAINHLHDTRYSLLTHDHDTSYAAKNHNHDTSYSAINHLHDTRYSLLTHNHDTSYSSINHNHDARYRGINSTAPLQLTSSGATSVSLTVTATGATGVGVSSNAPKYDFYAGGAGGKYGQFSGTIEVKLDSGATPTGLLVKATGIVDKSGDLFLPTVTLAPAAVDQGGIVGVLISRPTFLGPTSGSHWYTGNGPFGIVITSGMATLLVAADTDSLVGSSTDVAVGDLLIASPNVSGYAGPVDQTTVQPRYVVAKALEPITWTAESAEVNVGGTLYKYKKIAVLLFP